MTSLCENEIYRSTEKLIRPAPFLERFPKLFLISLLLLGSSLTHASTALPSASLDRGFLRLYDLNFSAAQSEFEAWQKLNPEDPMGAVSEAVGVLFSEFNRLGVLEAQFYESDSVFAARKSYQADPAQRTRFEQQLDRAEKMAKANLAKDGRDLDSLFAMTLSNGLRSDFAALIEKRNVASLHFTKEATSWSQQFCPQIRLVTTHTWLAV